MNSSSGAISKKLGKGAVSELSAVFEFRGGRTVLTDAFFSSPLKITKTFPIEGSQGGVSVTVMDISPGLMDGDEYQLSWHVGEGCHAAVTTQSFAKAHPSPLFGAKQHTRISVGAGASLVYAPQPTMLYAGSALRSTLEVDLAEGASLLLIDTLCAGRIHYGEAFKFASYESDLRIRSAGRLATANRLRLRPGEQSLQAVGAFEQFTHFGTLYAFGAFAGRPMLESVLGSVEGGGERVRCGASLAARGGLTASALGVTAWEVQEALLKMARGITIDNSIFAWPAEW